MFQSKMLQSTLEMGEPLRPFCALDPLQSTPELLGVLLMDGDRPCSLNYFLIQIVVVGIIKLVYIVYQNSRTDS